MSFSASPNATLDHLTAVPSEVFQFSHFLKVTHIRLPFSPGRHIWTRLRAWVSQKLELSYSFFIVEEGAGSQEEGRQEGIQARQGSLEHLGNRREEGTGQGIQEGLQSNN